MSEIKWETKCWGKVAHLFHNENTAVSHLMVTAGWRCSQHWHKERDNLFAVLSGRVVIKEWRNGGTGVVVTTTLGPGGVLTVPSGTLHQFNVIESGQMIEVYTPARSGAKVRLDDIERLDEGGRIDNS